MAEGLPSGRLRYRIGEVARWLGVDTHVVRFWEEQFGARYLGPLERTRSGQRVYSRRNAVALGAIRELLYVELYTIAGAKRQLRLADERAKVAG